MKQKFIDAYMDVACRFAKLSTANKLQVGCIIVKNDRIISIGYNGMPSGWTNECEDLVIIEYDQWLKSKPEVLHAEANAITKLARCNESGLGATLFVTHEPCIECAKLIYQSGIHSVHYLHSYMAGKGSGKEFLIESGVEVHCHE